MSPAWVLPTVRATSWWPLAVVACCLAVVAVPLHAGALGADGPADDLLGPVAAALAAAAVAGLRDPAAALLAAVPAPAPTRRTHRLVLLVPAALVVWSAWLALGDDVRPPDLLALVALVALGLAGALAAAGRGGAPVGASAALAVGTAAPVVWVLASRAGGHGWDAHVGALLVVGATALVLGRDR
ncbi:hypothetical protein [Nocardioides abyssi]|uniref:Uncharacterized protein n=1 Tax=Nocardioides abyssi TaxID=3058370 RepID=A0ABT8EYY8_9ACTN|nr:hypothetical protein [Nocardioides abyssi]MDN4163410.1 hypothetical protein [Nocardioides abyssi]